MKGWTCQRQTNGQRCGRKNPSRFQVCRLCGKRKPPRKRPAHLRALEHTYAEFIFYNGGVERCGICGAEPSGSRKLDRDHDHADGGRPRGLLCHRCNRQLPSWVTPEWLRAAADYLERSGVDSTTAQPEAVGKG